MQNAKLPRFYSRFLNPSSSGIDAFTESWHHEFGLFVPPISMVYRVIRKMEVDIASARCISFAILKFSSILANNLS